MVEDSRKVNGNGAVGYRIEMLSPWVRESVVGMEEVADEGWNGAGTGQQPWRAEEGTGRKVFGSKGRWNGGANGVSLFICLGSHVGEINPGFLRVRGVVFFIVYIFIPYICANKHTLSHLCVLPQQTQNMLIFGAAERRFLPQ